MTLDDALRAVLTAIRPHMGTDEDDPKSVEEAFVEAKKLFAEEPNAEAAFVAAVKTIAEAARVGYVKVEQ